MGNIYLKSLLLFKMDLFIDVPLHKILSLLLKKNLQFCVILWEKTEGKLGTLHGKTWRSKRSSAFLCGI